jgi:hypothetical protein
VRGSAISGYEHAKKVPELWTLHLLLQAMGYRYQDLDDTLAFIRRLKRPEEE